MKIQIAKQIKILTLVLVVSLVVIFVQNPAYGAIIKYEKEYVYQASELDSKSSSRTIALTQVKRLLLEELGTYLESETEVKNYHVTSDQITSISAGVVQTEIIDEKWDGKAYYLKARIAADPKEVTKTIAAFKSNRALLNEIDNSKQRISQLMKELDDLKKESKNDKNDKSLAKLYEEAVANISKSSSQGMETIGFEFLNAKQFDQALMFFSKAIETNPSNTSAYHGRALTYQALKEYAKSNRDCDRSIALAPDNELCYMTRGYNYFYLGSKNESIAAFSKVIEINSQNIGAYYSRALGYQVSGQTSKAILDYTKIIELDSANSDAYEGRGNAYLVSGNKQKAVEDYKTAAKLGSSSAQEKLRKLNVQQ